MPPDTHPSGSVQPPPPPRAGAHPDRIGPYRIVRVLGQGGMGLVYEAEQLEPFRRMVALKVIRHGMDTREVLARFESERQSIAVMDHPNIAKALDAGTTDSGLPYFVMELVQGQPITEYCDTQRLDVHHRLELFVAVCQGVQHAHQKGVIHRDLKPSNILVRVTDGKPVPTIIDFGIAKAVERRLSESAFTTELGVMVGTPAYMSPEQADASGLDIDTRTDIYSLGMVLYELVTGVLPFELRRVASLAADTATPVAHQRQTTPVGLRRELRGDLDWIVLKAIDRDRSRRYETANALGLDLQRHLDDKPVVARPPTALYTAGKFVRRHRVGVSVLATAAAALAVLVTGVARERNRAELAGAKAQAISTFLEDMLKSADPWQGGARQTTVVEALRAGVAKVNEDAIPDPLVAASIRRTIGTVYLGLGRAADADTLLRTALAERIARTGPSSEATAESYADLGWLYSEQGKFDSAGPAYERALAIRRRLRGGDTLVAASLLSLSGLALARGEWARADSVAREALKIFRAAHGDRHPSLAAAMSDIVSAQLSSGRWKEAEASAREALDLLRRLGRERSPPAVAIMNDLALSLNYQGRLAEAGTVMHEVVALDSALFGPAHPELASHLENLGHVYFTSGFQDSNIAVLKQALAIRRAMLADDNPAIGRSLFNLAATEYARGNYAAAEPLYEEALVRLRRALAAEHTDVVWATASLGRNQALLGRRTEGERNLRWALGVTDPDGRMSPEDYARIAPALVTLLLTERRYADAEPIALRVLTVRDSMADTLARQTAAQLVRLYEGWGKPERAAKYRR
jgi:tetratricopeptide (TPR) repeat protein